MSRWFRHYAGMMRDDKLVRVALRSKQPIERVCWVWGAILESAAEIDEEGRYDVDAAEVAYFLRADQSDVDAILDSLADAGRVAANRVVKWSNRQFQSDRSKERVAAHRQRKRAERADGNGETEAGNGDVTLQEQRRNAPETELETDTEKGDANASPPRKQAQAHPFPCPEGVDPQHWADFKANRKTKRLTNSQTAYEGILRDIERHADDEWPPGRLVEFAAGKGWGSINDPRGEVNGRPHSGTGRNGVAGPRPDPTLALVRAAIAAQRPDDGDRGDARYSLPARQLG